MDSLDIRKEIERKEKKQADLSDHLPSSLDSLTHTVHQSGGKSGHNLKGTTTNQKMKGR